MIRRGYGAPRIYPFSAAYGGLKTKDDKMYNEGTKDQGNGNQAKLTFEEFVELVKEMRHQQRRYFALRKPETLERSKELEREVDKAIERIEDKQMSLFGEN